ncbi:sigma-70 family RNA polymerase sigma factor [Staphylococcus coagulans]|nr:sigma-70 family RNA polymerase sigma factor [Staphylococcus coagulans]MBU3872568.1 sigma-70 family RNA polymerase sigma factor [Staphylococcus coagulans]MDR9832162.1 sigma-70 family RNA polymerase sigma factor [Staphylococcus coagulans]UNB48421.1 sigma-70 family RNA polymerase sigma factor [Staphylococcus coagulans]
MLYQYQYELDDAFSVMVAQVKARQPEAIVQLITYIEQYARKSFSDFSIMPADCEDLIQEVLLAIFKKIQSENFYYDVPFEHYIHRAIYLRKIDYRRKKMTHERLLDNYIERYTTQYQVMLVQQYQSGCTSQQFCHEVLKLADRGLSHFEMQVLKYLIEEWKPSEIALALKAEDKKIYNAIYRIRKKLKVLLDE